MGKLLVLGISALPWQCNFGFEPSVTEDDIIEKAYLLAWLDNNLFLLLLSHLLLPEPLCCRCRRSAYLLSLSCLARQL